MSILSDLEDNLVAMLKGAAGLESVKTFETSVRECLFSGQKLTQGFRPEELPAINVSAQLKPSRSAPFSAGEKQYEIPVTVAIVTKDQKAKRALQAVYELQTAVERVLDQARRSGNALGPNVLVSGDVTSSATTIDEKPHSGKPLTLVVWQAIFDRDQGKFWRKLPQLLKSWVAQRGLIQRVPGVAGATIVQGVSGSLSLASPTVEGPQAPPASAFKFKKE